MKYTTQHIQQLFSISHQAAKNWADRFADHLSPTASPGKGKERQFTEDDLRVLTLVSELKQGGMKEEDIHATLYATAPDMLPEINTSGLTIVQGESARLLVLLQQTAELQQQLDDARLQAAQKDGQIALLKEQLAEARQEILKLERDNARHSDHDD